MTRHFHSSLQSPVFLKRHKDLLLQPSIYYLLCYLLTEILNPEEQSAHLQLTCKHIKKYNRMVELLIINSKLSPTAAEIAQSV
jgi:hypothetical protein